MNSIGAAASAGDFDEEEWQINPYWVTADIPYDEFLQDIMTGESFSFDNEVPSSGGWPVPLVGQPLAPRVEGRQSPLLSSAPDPGFGPHPSLEAGFSKSLKCKSDTTEGHYRVTPDAQGFFGFPSTNCSAVVHDTRNGDPVTKLEADARASTCTSPSPGAPVPAAYVSERVLSTGSASPKRSCPTPQQKLYHCELRITRAQPPFEQTTCGQTFARSKDLKRHQSTVHREDDDPVYLCHCGKDNPRKDNHSRHVGRCAEPPCGRSYVCKCSHPSQERYDHLEHIKSCSPGKGSRRRRNAS